MKFAQLVASTGGFFGHSVEMPMVASVRGAWGGGGGGVAGLGGGVEGGGGNAIVYHSVPPT